MLEHLRIYDKTILKIYNVFFDSRSFCVTMVVVVVVVVVMVMLKVVVVVVVIMIPSSGSTKCQF